MPYLHTCKTCKLKGAPCATRDRLLAAIAGHGISSLKHKCPSYEALLTPGMACVVRTVAYLGADDDDGEGYRPPPQGDYPGVFLKLTAKGSALVFVKKGQLPIGNVGAHSYEFEPGGNGVVKAPFYRVKPISGDAVCVDECRGCGAITTLGWPCGKDPNYTPLSQCQAHLRTLALPLNESKDHD